MKCKQYQLNSQIIKCSDNQHSEHCLKEQELKKQFLSAKEIIWNPEKQNWTIHFDYLDKSTKSKKVQKEEMEVFEEEKE